MNLIKLLLDVYIYGLQGFINVRPSSRHDDLVWFTDHNKLEEKLKLKNEKHTK